MPHQKQSSKFWVIIYHVKVPQLRFPNIRMQPRHRNISNPHCCLRPPPHRNLFLLRHINNMNNLRSIRTYTFQNKIARFHHLAPSQLAIFICTTHTPNSSKNMSSASLFSFAASYPLATLLDIPSGLVPWTLHICTGLSGDFTRGFLLRLGRFGKGFLPHPGAGFRCSRGRNLWWWDWSFEGRMPWIYRIDASYRCLLNLNCQLRWRWLRRLVDLLLARFLCQWGHCNFLKFKILASFLDDFLTGCQLY